MQIELDYAELGKRIRFYRKRAGLTQEKLAEKADMVTSNISHIERGTTKISLSAFVRLANILGVTLDPLVCDSLTQDEDYLLQDFRTLLEDCSPDERRFLRDIMEVTKRTLRQHRADSL